VATHAACLDALPLLGMVRDPIAYVAVCGCFQSPL
jgi:hypothetical protein